MRYIFVIGALHGACTDNATRTDQPTSDVLEQRMGQTLYWQCDEAQNRWRVEADHTFVWRASHRDTRWESVHGTWELTRKGPGSVGLILHGTHQRLDPSDNQPVTTPWQGTVSIAALDALPQGAFIEEAMGWTKACALPQTNPFALWEQAHNAGAIALTGSLEGVFAPATFF